MTYEMTVVKSHNGISLKGSVPRQRTYQPIIPSRQDRLLHPKDGSEQVYD